MSYVLDPDLFEHNEKCRLCLEPFDDWKHKKRLLRISVAKKIYDLMKIKV
jgi:hypothetical protein